MDKEVCTMACPAQLIVQYNNAFQICALYLRKQRLSLVKKILNKQKRKAQKCPMTNRLQKKILSGIQFFIGITKTSQYEPVWSVFEAKRYVGIHYTALHTEIVNISHTSQYSMVFTTLHTSNQNLKYQNNLYLPKILKPSKP